MDSFLWDKNQKLIIFGSIRHLQNVYKLVAYLTPANFGNSTKKKIVGIINAWKYASISPNEISVTIDITRVSIWMNIKFLWYLCYKETTQYKSRLKSLLDDPNWTAVELERKAWIY